MAKLQLTAEVRRDAGKGASRRLRRANKVPAILYGAGKEPLSLQFEHHVLRQQVANEAFYSSILSVSVDGRTERAVVKDLQRHPIRPILLHMDLQRIDENEALRMHVPLHFLNEATCPGVKAGGQVSHHMIEVEVQCLPKDLPEYIEVDIGGVEMNGIVHLSDLKIPAGVELTGLRHGDAAVATVHPIRATQTAAEEAEAAAAAAAASAAASAAAGTAAPAAGGDKKS